jgi:predicted AlkP superfamily pyrophosphatase or phosphodiesterase
MRLPLAKFQKCYLSSRCACFPCSTFKFIFIVLFSALFSGLFFGGCQTKSDLGSHQSGRVQQVPNSSMLVYDSAAENSDETLKKPYLVMVSIDGYRFDYNKKFSPPNLSQIGVAGVQAESLQPVYPSKTFPNHFSIVTGMYADHHGIVSNEFYDPARDAKYSLPDRAAVEDGSWYFGEPIWLTAGRQGMLSAAYYWVGSESDIQGGHPNYFYRYDDSVPVGARIDQVLTWLKLPEKKRPHLINLYIESVDAAAHRYGVDSKEVRDAVAAVDLQIGRLRDGLKELHLPINLMVVSDHGMFDVDRKKLIVLDEEPAAARILAKFQAVGRGPQMLLYLNKGESASVIEEAQKVLKKSLSHCRVWRRSEMKRFNYSSTPRVGDLIIEPDLPYIVGLRTMKPALSGGNHGWDPVKNKVMHGVFMAEGPNLKEGTKLPTIENVNVYPMALAILGLKQRVPSDGSLDASRAALK